MLVSIEQGQRTSINDVVVISDTSESDLEYFKNQKYRNLVRPYQKFIFYKNFMLVGHGNILSYYDTDLETWKCHYKFKEGSDDVQVDLN